MLPGCVGAADHRPPVLAPRTPRPDAGSTCRQAGARPWSSSFPGLGIRRALRRRLCGLASMLMTARACATKNGEGGAGGARRLRHDGGAQTSKEVTSFAPMPRRRLYCECLWEKGFHRRALTNQQDAGSILLRLGHRLLLARPCQCSSLQHARTRTPGVSPRTCRGERGDADPVHCLIHHLLFDALPVERRGIDSSVPRS